MSSNPNFAFFGTSELSVKILDKLIENGYVPSLVVTAPDKPKGRKMIMTPPPVKVFAQAHNFKIDQPSSLSTYNPASSAGRLQPTYRRLLRQNHSKINFRHSKIRNAECPPVIIAEIQRPIAHPIFYFKRGRKDGSNDNANGRQN